MTFFKMVCEHGTHEIALRENEKYIVEIDGETYEATYLGSEFGDNVFEIANTSNLLFINDNRTDCVIRHAD